jgi:hypothetical protein
MNFSETNDLCFSIFFFILNRWDYSNPGYLDALKHLNDLKEEG